MAMIGSCLLLAHCATHTVPNAVRVGSTNSDDNRMIAEIFASALERKHIPVDRHLGLGDEQSAMSALEQGKIDMYPGFVEMPRENRGITWLAAAPANDSPCLIASPSTAEQFWLLRLTKCAAIAHQLRLAATADFLAPGGTLDGLRRRYGGFDFKAIVKCDPGSQFYALNRGDADIANGLTTDPNIGETQLIVLNDDKHFWPERHLAPVVRVAALRAHPRMRAVLDRISPKLTLYALQRLNTRRAVLGMDPRDIADDFVASF